MADTHDLALTGAELDRALAKAAALPEGALATEDFVREQLKELEVSDGLPPVTETDNDSLLFVADGVWVKGTLAASPIKTYIDNYISEALGGEY